jgi:hypothetical protein
MTTHNPDRLAAERAAQDAALTAAADAALPQRNYRALYGALDRIGVPALPADFAQRVAARIADLDEQADVERWLLRLLGIALGVGVLLFAGQALADNARQLASALHASNASVPWSMITATAVTLGMAAGLDGFLSSGRRRS